jgi:hypothetical protein
MHKSYRNLLLTRLAKYPACMSLEWCSKVFFTRENIELIRRINIDCLSIKPRPEINILIAKFFEQTDLRRIQVLKTLKLQ